MTDPYGSNSDIISLAGEWQFRLDPGKKGIDGQWYAQRLDDSVRLPGTTDENARGEKVDEQCDDRLSRVWRWIAPAWYRRTVTIPARWDGKHVTLLLERTKHTRVWVDTTFIGAEDSLGAPQVYDLSAALTPGDHALTICVDNANLPPVGPAHAVDERTQTNWNGIIGRLELEAREPIRIDDLQLYPDIANRSVTVEAVIGNQTPWRGRADMTVSVDLPGAGRTVTGAVAIEEPTAVFKATVPLGPAAPLWDEFNPRLIRLTATLEAAPDGRVLRDERSVTFGLREFRAHNARFAVNGRPVFLRGKNDACIYPLTGYPPMDKAGWLRVLGIAKRYGINHYRFHSWCPPEAAFAAADELGFYFQPELPNKRAVLRPKSRPYVLPANAFETRDEATAGPAAEPEATAEYLRREGEKMLKAFGNHPSFVMLTLGNEIGGDRDQMKELCDHFRALDPRHLYAQGTNHFHWEPGLQDGDEFWVTGTTGKDRPVRGSFFQAQAPGFVENRPPSTTVDFSRSIADVPVPVVGHETGQYQVSPDFSEIPKYTGVLRARNLEIFKKRLEAAGMLDQAADFVRASGALSVICYREDIEAALRTPGFGGFQLLDLQDFPGQGTALVGMLNAFMESKGLVEPERWREFCCETVPLLGMEKYTWTTAETFAGRLRVAHYGQADLPGASLEWTLADSRGAVLRSGRTAPGLLRQGEVNELGALSFPLSDLAAPHKMDLTLSLPGTPYRNRYPLWVYPATADTRPPADMHRFQSLDAAARAVLADGGKVLLLPEIEGLGNAVKGSFQCDFWCWPMFRRAALRENVEVAPGTLGILCDPAHPALARFPTDFHSDWQWWHLVKNSRPIILDETPADYRPLVQVVDNFARNHKLGILFEARVEAGRLLVCSVDLPNLQHRPEARQLLASLTAYMQSPRFAPAHTLDPFLLARLLA